MERDELFLESARLVVIKQHASAGMIHTRLKIPYHRAGKIMDQLETANIVGKFNGQKSRVVLMAGIDNLNKHLSNEPS